MQKSKKIFSLVLFGILILVVIFFILKNYKISTEKNQNNSQATYDSTLIKKYIASQNVWPPQVNSRDSSDLECTEGGNIFDEEGESVVKIIDNKTYCVTTTSKGSAGNTYTTYHYAMIKNGKLITAHFVLKYAQCENYNNPQKKECQSEQQNLNVDKLANAVIMNALKTNNYLKI